MCLILIGYRIREDHPLVIAANRDEFFERPTKQAHFGTIILTSLQVGMKRSMELGWV